MQRNRIAAAEPRGLSIGELAERTNVPAATLRSWEDRHGFPSPQRLASRHRRYSGGDVALIEAIMGLRSAGMSLRAAISQVTSQATEGEPSVFAGLRRRYPELTPQVLRKATLLALTRAIEDECCARGGHGVLFAGFQRERFFRHSEERWHDLARTARLVVVLAEFSRPAMAGPAPAGQRVPVKVHLAPGDPACREWILVCESDYPACLAGWELPGQQHAADASRRFEVIWSADPQVVHSAATICAQLTRAARPDIRRVLDSLPSESPAPASADLRRAAALLTRMTGYLEDAVT